MSKKKQLAIIGSASVASIKSAAKKRETRGALCVTQCQPQPSFEDYDFKSKVFLYNFHKVESVKIKFDTYTSFKVSVLLGDQKPNQFIREVIKPNMWGMEFLLSHLAWQRYINND